MNNNENVDKSKRSEIRPVLVWERTDRKGGTEATVHEVNIGGGDAMPVIRIVSSGFGAPQAKLRGAATGLDLRCAA